MYYPYVRGKQFELQMLREMAPQLHYWNFTPVIEPVKKNLPVLKRTLDALIDNNCQFVVLANPNVGDMKDDGEDLANEIINGHLANYDHYSVGLNLTAKNTITDADQLFAKFSQKPLSIIHNGFSEGKNLAELIASRQLSIQEHIFVEKQNSILYRKNFSSNKRVIIENGFINRKNREYPKSEPFSELYLTFKSELGCDGFGDFLIVGSDFTESGGPAHAIAIHLTYIDPESDNAIGIKHYVSDDVDTPQNPGGKYLQALKKLYDDVTSPTSFIYQSEAVKEYLQFYSDKHFPGLGYTKKLSMQHHIELMAHALTAGA